MVCSLQPEYKLEFNVQLYYNFLRVRIFVQHTAGWQNCVLWCLLALHSWHAQLLPPKVTVGESGNGGMSASPDRLNIFYAVPVLRLILIMCSPASGPILLMPTMSLISWHITVQICLHTSTTNLGMTRTIHQGLLTWATIGSLACSMRAQQECYSPEPSPPDRWWRERNH